MEHSSTPYDYVTGDELTRLIRDDFLLLIPEKAEELDWKFTQKEVSVTLQKERRGIFGLKPRKVVFDEVGAFVLTTSEGNKTVREIAKLLSEAFRTGQEQAETSLIQYLTTLHGRGFIRLRKPPNWTPRATPTPALGTPIRRCGQCGSTLPVEAVFCPQCGAKVT